MAQLTAEESAIMADLLSGLDDGLSDYTPTPVKTKTTTASRQPSSPLAAKPPSRKTPVKNKWRASASELHKRNSPLKQRRVEISPLKRRLLAKSPKTAGAKENQNLISKPNGRTPKKQRDEQAAALLAGLDDIWDWEADLAEEAAAPSKPKAKPVNIAAPSNTNTRQSRIPKAAPQLPIRLKYSSNTPNTNSKRYNPDPVTRCIVVSVNEIETGKYKREKHLIVRKDPGWRAKDDGQRMLVALKDDWILTNVVPGDVINVIGQFTQAAATSLSKIVSSIAVTALENTVVLHPDILLTSTSVSSTSQCSRKPLISSLLHSPFNVTEATTWGSMLHEVMQDCMAEGRWEKSFVEEKIDKIARTELDQLLRVNAGVEKAKLEVRARAVGIAGFSKKYIGNEPKPEATLIDSTAKSSTKATLALSGLHDIEEDIWSPTYGLKGKVDASVQATVKEGKSKFSQTMPFEIKTGKSTHGPEHRAQTILYTLLMAERYLSEIPAGLLYYTQSESLIRVTPSRHELRGLIMSRNDTASYLARRLSAGPSPSQEQRANPDDAEVDAPSSTAVIASSDNPHFLPPTIDQTFTCGKCYAVDGCMLYRKAVEGVVDENSEIADLYDMKTSHLTPARAKFFKDWENLLSLEEQGMVRFRKELWTMSADERERSGRCFSDMVMVRHEDHVGNGVARHQQHVYWFEKRSIPSTQRDGSSSLLSGHIAKGDAMTISVEPHVLAFSRGFVIELTPKTVAVGFDRPLNLDGVVIGGASAVKAKGGGQMVFRLDRDEMTGGMSRIRYNLASLFFAGGDTKCLELVVDLRAPQFDKDILGLSPELQAAAPAQLNPSQQLAMRKVLRARDYALILGMPGTGKTTTIAEIIKELVRRNQTVLLTSYTHSAVDTILSKLVDVDFDILRLGNEDKVHPDVRKFTLGHRPPPTTLEQLERQIMHPRVVATTCLSLDHSLFSRRTFDYCIVDEASQITLPTCLGPLQFADRFVLVGDHFQLPPLVRSPEARQGGLDVSLFRRLSEAHPEAVVDLVYQYRMNEEIMFLSNSLVYNNRLRCGSEAVAMRTLDIPDREPLRNAHSNSLCSGGKDCWIETVLDPSRKAIFLDTDAVPARESRKGDLVQNEVEAQLIHELVSTLVATGVQQSQIGIISPYRQQIKHLCYIFEDMPEVEILTADRSQGRDKDCIILSMVRSNESGQVGDLLRDSRRMNVSLTRAKSKLILVGSRGTLGGVPLLNQLFGLMQEKDWIFKLPKYADSLHPSPSAQTSSSPPKRSLEEEGDSAAQAKGASKTSRKKPRTSAEVVVKGRYILQDLLNAAL